MMRHHDTRIWSWPYGPMSAHLIFVQGKSTSVLRLAQTCFEQHFDDPVSIICSVRWTTKHAYNMGPQKRTSIFFAGMELIPFLLTPFRNISQFLALFQICRFVDALWNFKPSFYAIFSVKESERGFSELQPSHALPFLFGNLTLDAVQACILLSLVKTYDIWRRYRPYSKTIQNYWSISHMSHMYMLTGRALKFQDFCRVWYSEFLASLFPVSLRSGVLNRCKAWALQMILPGAKHFGHGLAVVGVVF